MVVTLSNFQIDLGRPGFIVSGAPAPGSELENAIEPAKRATAQTSTRCRPLRGLLAFILILTWGWRPRLYAVARFAGFQLMHAPLRGLSRDRVIALLLHL